MLTGYYKAVYVFFVILSNSYKCSSGAGTQADDEFAAILHESHVFAQAVKLLVKLYIDLRQFVFVKRRYCGK